VEQRPRWKSAVYSDLLDTQKRGVSIVDEMPIEKVIGIDTNRNQKRRGPGSLRSEIPWGRENK